MIRIYYTLSILLFCITFINAQERVVRGTITYLTADALYISLGREAGIRDSSLVFALRQHDTVAVLKVLATSSKSSICSVVEERKKPVVGDVVVGTVMLPDSQRPKTTLRHEAAESTAAVPPRDVPLKEHSPDALALHGRINTQYFLVRQSNGSPDAVQPGVSFDIRGKFNTIPLQFDFAGNIRSSVSGSDNPFASGGANRTRVYRASMEYNDPENRAAVGRLMPALNSPAGYVDGVLFARKLGALQLGVAGGLEPAVSFQNASKDLKKLLVFGSYQPVSSRLALAVNVSYTRTFFQSYTDREVISASVNAAPSATIYAYAQSDVDLRTKSGEALVVSPKLTNLFTNINYRLTDRIAIGGGLGAWRPSYTFSSVRFIQDSLLDTKLRVSPVVSVNVSFPAGVSLYNTYTPRSSDEGFGTEYSNSTSMNITGIPGVGLRGTMTTNVAQITTTRGYGASLQKSVAGSGDVTIRYQFYRYEVPRSLSTATNKSLAIDMLFAVWKNVTLWGSIERFLMSGADATNILLDAGWRF